MLYFKTSLTTFHKIDIYRNGIKSGIIEIGHVTDLMEQLFLPQNGLITLQL